MTQNTDPHCSGLNPEDYEELTGFVGDWRDTWWDQDFLQMMARKWRAQSIGTVLDVGCGVGHWGQRLMTLMGEEATLEGVDAESSWIDKAHTRATSQGLGDRARFQVADAYALPYQDGVFDMVTCQTLLMHVKDPQAAVREMARVLRPGGLFVAAEPNNFGSSAGSMVAGPRKSWEEISPLLEMEYICAQGKEALGEGNYSVGEHVPAFLLALGWTNIQVQQNSQCAQKIPPYDTPGEQTSIDMLRKNHETGAAMALGGTIDNVRRLYQAGGGDPDRFEFLFGRIRANGDELMNGFDTNTFISSGGHIHYLVWGRKPEG